VRTSRLHPRTSRSPPHRADRLGAPRKRAQRCTTTFTRTSDTGGPSGSTSHRRPLLTRADIKAALGNRRRYSPTPTLNVSPTSTDTRDPSRQAAHIRWSQAVQRQRRQRQYRAALGDASKDWRQFLPPTTAFTDPAATRAIYPEATSPKIDRIPGAQAE
jgi:hypothetical protein